MACERLHSDMDKTREMGKMQNARYSRSRAFYHPVSSTVHAGAGVDSTPLLTAKVPGLQVNVRL